ncbi:hypothetical protein PM082_015253 [Marasmius tenuissimus]|nr:hypothetical protein PM082_015253 [Marasmius tenuissimus]
MVVMPTVLFSYFLVHPNSFHVLIVPITISFSARPNHGPQSRIYCIRSLESETPRFDLQGPAQILAGTPIVTEYSPLTPIRQLEVFRELTRSCAPQNPKTKPIPFIWLSRPRNAPSQTSIQIPTPTPVSMS